MPKCVLCLVSVAANSRVFLQYELLIAAALEMQRRLHCFLGREAFEGLLDHCTCGRVRFRSSGANFGAPSVQQSALRSLLTLS